MKKEMEKLIAALTALEIPFEVFSDMFGNDQVWYPTRENPKMDVICHQYSYGGSEGLLEIMGLLTEEESECDSVVGYLDAENVLARILKDRQEEVDKLSNG